jgi:hypothetical protein
MEKQPNFSPEKQDRENNRIDVIFESAIKQHDVLKNVPETEIKTLIRSVLEEIDLFEKVGKRDKKRLDVPLEVARNIVAIWDFSGPGTYDKPFKEDRYKDYKWAEGMDRARLNHTALLARKITEAIIGGVERGELSRVQTRIARSRENIREVGPFIIYNGTEEENAVVRDVLTRQGVVVPAEKVIIPEGRIEKTSDQIAKIKLPESVDIGGKEVAIVSHAPHLSRVIRMINRYRPFPENTKIRLFPLPTPQAGKFEYAMMEIRGILYYVYVSPDSEATKDPYTYLLSTEIEKDNIEQGN